jgi:aryl-phospho-beta-D-glucosidase BglC (GH1 family)
MMQHICKVLIKVNLVSLILWAYVASNAYGQTLPTAAEIARKMGVGWNLGNTLDAIGGETAWGNPKTTQKLIDAVKAAGFNTIRLPVSWDSHSDQSTNKIDAAWMARVKEVVDYCIKANMYVIINIHWDNGWLEKNCTSDKKSSVNEKQKTYWTQIADYFKSYDGRLLFASANEPNVEDASQMSVLLSYHQTFIDAVRATGGNNSSRVLVIQGPSTDIEKTNKLMSTMPTDKISNRLMAEVHYYTPWNFCGLTEDASWGKMFYYWGQENHSKTDASRNPTWGEESTVDSYFQSMKSRFVDKGIPVILGEFGAIKRASVSGGDLALHKKSREYYNGYVAKASVKNGLIPIYWDNGASDFSLFNRNTGAVTDQGVITAMMKGAGNNITATLDAERLGSNEMRSLDISIGKLTSGFMLTISDPQYITRVTLLDQMGRKIAAFNHADIAEKMKIGRDLKPGMYLVCLTHVVKGMQTFTVAVSE